MAMRTEGAHSGPSYYAKYDGKRRRFPHGEEVVPGTVYLIAFCESSNPSVAVLVDVETEKGWVYLPYGYMDRFWADWTPYAGEVV